MRQRAYRLQRARLYLKAELGGKADGAEHPERVLVKAALRLAHAAEKAAPEVVPPAEGVRYLPGCVHGHGVHGEIAPREVGFQRTAEGDAVGTAVVGVGALGAEGGDLDLAAGGEDGDRAVLYARGHAAREEGEHLLRHGGGGGVPVRGAAAKQAVAHAAPGEYGLVTGRAEGA